jgi:3-oxoacyl-[acyl-carrier-protein] synthase-1
VLSQACTLVRQHGVPQVLVVATDSLLTGPTLSHFERADRLLTTLNSNGFMGGEGAGALLVSKLAGRRGLRLEGFGFAVEAAHIDSEEPLRGDGLTAAIKAALAQAGQELHDMNYRIADVSGEQYYFKEASLALNRTLRKRKGEFELWHPAESIGETGATAGVACFAAGHFAALKGYAPGPRAILHFGTDQGARAAVVAIAA